jgi:hypothetical protein
MKVKAIDGKPVFDAKRPISLTITPNDIAKADRKEPIDCAVARACRRELHAKEARVHLGRVYVRMNEGNWQRFVTPKALRSEIIAFDRGGSFEPGTFALLPPSPSKVATGKRRGGKTPVRKARRVTGSSKRIRHVVTDVRTGPA